MNLLAPLAFHDGEIDRFLKLNVCAICRSRLVKRQAGQQWISECPNHGPIMAHNFIRIERAQESASNELAALSEIRREQHKCKPRRSEIAILNELGY